MIREETDRPRTAQAKTVQSWLDNIISRRINVTHVSMQEARQKESRTGVWFVNKLKEWLSQKDSNIFWATGIRTFSS